MNSQEAKFILQAYRHNGADARDPHFVEALAQVERDPELAAWMAEDQKLHRTVHQGLQSIPVPHDLKSNILAGGKIIRPTTRWRQPVMLAVAASFILLLSLMPQWLSRDTPGDAASFRESMSRFLNTEFNNTLDLETNDLAALHQWLGKESAPTSLELPPGLAQGTGIGCRVLDYNGSKVSLVCFRAQGTVAHLFVIDNPGWTDLPPADQPFLAPSGFWMTASWTRGNRAYLLASQGSEDDIRRIL